MLDELLPYYEREISHLRYLGREFAREYPKIAARLQLEGDHCEDPHTERLVESFAFLSARVHKKLDDDLPEIVEAFLDVLYPHYLRPTPSLSIAQLDPGEQTSLTGCYKVARHTEMFSRPVEGVACRFRTCYPVEVWPLRVESAGFSLLERSAFNGRDKDSVARLDLAFEALNDQPVGSFGIDRLRLFLDGEGALMHPMYELLFNNLTRLSVSFDEGGQRREVTLPLDSLKPVGYGAEEGLIDYPERSFLGYRLLHEYFTFPDKFMFLDVEGLTRLLARASGSRFELHFHFADYALDERLSRLAQSLGRNHFRLGCTPVINLFQRQAEPILLTHTQAEYPVVADVRNPHGAEVISIDRVTRVQKTAQRDHIRYCPPFFEPQGAAPSRETSYWLSRRVPSARERDSGTELLLRLADRELNAIEATSDVLSLKLTCSNRDLPQRLSFGHPRGDFTLPREQVVKAIRCLRKPTPSARPPMGKGVIWRLISHLSLNHLSLVERGRDVLLEMLTLYNYRDLEATRRQINGITRIQSEPTMTRIGHPRPAFVRGTGITLELDEQEFIGSGIFVFGMVLDHFFGQYCSLNSFTRLTLRSRQREKDVVTWPPRTGTQPLV